MNKLKKGIDYMSISLWEDFSLFKEETVNLKNFSNIKQKNLIIELNETWSNPINQRVKLINNTPFSINETQQQSMPEELHGIIATVMYPIKWWIYIQDYFLDWVKIFSLRYIIREELSEQDQKNNWIFSKIDLYWQFWDFYYLKDWYKKYLKIILKYFQIDMNKNDIIKRLDLQEDYENEDIYTISEKYVWNLTKKSYIENWDVLETKYWFSSNWDKIRVYNKKLDLYENKQNTFLFDYYKDFNNVCRIEKQIVSKSLKDWNINSINFVLKNEKDLLSNIIIKNFRDISNNKKVNFKSRSIKDNENLIIWNIEHSFLMLQAYQEKILKDMKSLKTFSWIWTLDMVLNNVVWSNFIDMKKFYLELYKTSDIFDVWLFEANYYNMKNEKNEVIEKNVKLRQKNKKVIDKDQFLKSEVKYYKTFINEKKLQKKYSNFKKIHICINKYNNIINNIIYN